MRDLARNDAKEALADKGEECRQLAEEVLAYRVEERRYLLDRFTLSRDPMLLNRVIARAIGAVLNAEDEPGPPHLGGSSGLPPMRWDLSNIADLSIAARRLAGTASLRAFELSGNSDNLDGCITWLSSAVPPDRFDDWPPRDVAADLTQAFLARHELLRFRADLDRAVAVGRRAATEVPDPQGPNPRHLTILGDALLRRHRFGGVEDDLDEATRCFEAGGKEPLWWAARPPSGGYAAALGVRWRRDGDEGDLQKGLELVASGLFGPPSDAARSRWLCEIGEHYLTRATAADLPDLLRPAVELLEEAAREGGSPCPQALAAKLKLAKALRNCYRHRGERAEIDRAVAVAREAVGAAPADSAIFAKAQMVLAQCLRDRFRRPAEPLDPYEPTWFFGDPMDLRNALLAYRSAADSALHQAPEQAIDAAIQGGIWEGDLGRWHESAQLFRVGIEAMHGLVAEGLGRWRTERILERSRGMTTRGAFALAAPETSLAPSSSWNGAGRCSPADRDPRRSLRRRGCTTFGPEAWRRSDLPRTSALAASRPQAMTEAGRSRRQRSMQSS